MIAVVAEPGFADAVEAVIQAIEPGEIMTYGEVAAEAGFPGAARAVGNHLRLSGGTLPWWRVVAMPNIASPVPIPARRLTAGANATRVTV